MKQFFPMKGAISYVAIATVIFSHVKISCFRAKAHLVFHWCLNNKKFYQLHRLIHTIYHHKQIEKLTISGASSSSERIFSMFLSSFPFVYIQMDFSAAIETVETF